MSQQINMINPALIKRRDFLTPVNIGLLYGVIAAVMLTAYVTVSHQLKALTQKQDQASAQLVQLQAGLVQLTAMRAPKPLDSALAAKLKKLEETQQVQTQILKAISHTQLQTQSLTAYMRGFARQTMDKLWLTGFEINQENHTVTLRGRSLSADALPEYMKKLGNEPIFAGQAFGGLNMRQPEMADTASSNNKDSTAPETVKLPQFVEFELQGVETTTSSTAPDQTSSNQAVQGQVTAGAKS